MSITISRLNSSIPSDPKSTPCLINPEMHNKREIFKNEMRLDCQ